MLNQANTTPHIRELAHPNSDNMWNMMWCRWWRWPWGWVRLSSDSMTQAAPGTHTHTHCTRLTVMIHGISWVESFSIPLWKRLQYFNSPSLHLLFLFLAIIGFKRASTLSQDMLTCSIRTSKRAVSFLRSALLLLPLPLILNRILTAFPSIVPYLFFLTHRPTIFLFHPFPMFYQSAFISFYSHSSLSPPSLSLTMMSH